MVEGGGWSEKAGKFRGQEYVQRHTSIHVNKNTETPNDLDSTSNLLIN